MAVGVFQFSSMKRVVPAPPQSFLMQFEMQQLYGYVLLRDDVWEARINAAATALLVEAIDHAAPELA